MHEELQDTGCSAHNIEVDSFSQWCDRSGRACDSREGFYVFSVRCRGDPMGFGKFKGAGFGL